MKIRRFTMKNMSAKRFMALLNKIDACQAAKEFCEGKTFKQAWDECQNGNWMSFLLWSVHQKDSHTGYKPPKDVNQRFGTYRRYDNLYNSDERPRGYRYVDLDSHRAEYADYWRKYYRVGK